MTQMKLLRIFTDEAAYYGDVPVYEEIARRARIDGMAGATVVQALFGFGRSAHTHRKHLLEDEQSLIVEIVDDDARLRVFALALSDMEGIGLMTLQPVEVIGDVIPAETRQ